MMAEADASEREQLASPSEGTEIVARASDAKEEDEGPASKKRKIATEENSDKLEHRLGGILCCAVCLDLPQAAVYQCSNGHLMCAPCFTHLMADARLRDEPSTCPNCRVEMSKPTASRNLAVEKTVSELPLACRFCTRVFPRHSLDHHQNKICEERQTGCQYSVIGCPWLGPAHEARAHEASCPCPSRSAGEVVAMLIERERALRDQHTVYKQIMELMSYEKVSINELQLKPYRTEEFVHKLYYETPRFPAFHHQWVVKAYVNNNQPDPTQSALRELSYQVILKSKTLCPLSMQWVWLRGPYGEAPLRSTITSHLFTEEITDSPPLPLPLADPSADTNKLLSDKAIHLRLVLFLASK